MVDSAVGQSFTKPLNMEGSGGGGTLGVLRPLLLRFFTPRNVFCCVLAAPL